MWYTGFLINCRSHQCAVSDTISDVWGKWTCNSLSQQTELVKLSFAALLEENTKDLNLASAVLCTQFLYILSTTYLVTRYSKVMLRLIAILLPTCLIRWSSSSTMHRNESMAPDSTPFSHRPHRLHQIIQRCQSTSPYIHRIPRVPLSDMINLHWWGEVG